ncbi:O-fucosyltransferase family protein [Populus alba x Populus x berolinensis]|uniref:O-fucosyltransferase family protein n=1 Tax=Populus alba x Populus x berolinensis TaxID=444605 RepID=A0AAD6W377_9ROSI|nr:O-fucosyltransferase family protein [Populus alba x Populus x berolinensis]KAJ6997575.1 O-fucosyltransferase family protein [Populus alba x Populus x berolinensis]
MDDKKSLASAEELAKVNGKASLLAAVDYFVSLQSDVFISASPGNMHNALIQRSESCLMSLAKETCAGPQIAFNHDA